MNHKFIISTVIASVAFSSLALAHDQYPGQPNVQGAFNKLMAATAQLEKAKIETPGEHAKHAIVEINSAKTFLELAVNDKGTYLHTAKGLCDQAITALESSTPELDKASELTSRALHEVKMAGHAGNHRGKY
jgi:hypothetical protein